MLFALNDVSQIKPPAGAIGPDERLIGPVFDESAVRFFLVYNSKAKVFHYILDETAPVPDELAAVAAQRPASWSASAPASPTTATIGSTAKS